MSNKAAEKTAAAADDVAGLAKESSARMGNLVAETQRTMSEQFEKVSKNLEGLSVFGQENVEAVVRSSEIAAKALEGIGSEISAYSKKTFEDSVAAAQDFASAKTMTELFEKQTAYAQTAFEGWLHQTTKMNEIVVAAAKDISAPINQRFTAAQDVMRGFAR